MTRYQLTSPESLSRKVLHDVGSTLYDASRISYVAAGVTPRKGKKSGWSSVCLGQRSIPADPSRLTNSICQCYPPNCFLRVYSNVIFRLRYFYTFLERYLAPFHFLTEFSHKVSAVSRYISHSSSLTLYFL